MTSLFCRHNRFTAECPICSKGTVLEGVRERAEPGARPARPRAAKPKREPLSPSFTGPFVSSGPLDDGREVRLEKVPGGLRLAVWRGGTLEREAPVMPAGALRAMLSEAGEHGILAWDDWGRIEAALGEPGAETGHAASTGTSGDLKEELRVERLPDGSVRVARWLYWPGTGGGWQLQEAPPMLPPARYVQAFAGAAEQGLL